jgi:hypothetical protein
MTYKVVYVDLPLAVHGAVTLLDDGSHLIVINDTLEDAEKQKTLRHELEHIRLDHFHDPRPIWEIEAEADM